MMSLEEAIQHCKEKEDGCTKCGEEHRQLRKWLEELKEYKSRSFQLGKGEKSVLIKKLRLPKSDGVITCYPTMKIFPDGRAYLHHNNYDYEMQEIPPHGNLIEKEPLMQFIEDGINAEGGKSFGHDGVEILTEVEYADIIIPSTLQEKRKGGR